MTAIEIFTKEDCPICVDVKQFLKDRGVKYTEYMIGKGITREQVLTLFPNAKLVPIIKYEGIVLSSPVELKEKILACE